MFDIILLLMYDKNIPIKGENKMILNITTEQFTELTPSQKKKVFSEFLGNKVNEIVSGSMTNGKWGEYTIRHDECAYSKIKIEPNETGNAHLTIYNFIEKEWIEHP